MKRLRALRLERDGHRVADRDGVIVRLSPAGGKSYRLRVRLRQDRPWITLDTCEDLTLGATCEFDAKMRKLLQEDV